MGLLRMLSKALQGKPEPICLRVEHAMAAADVAIDREAGTIEGISVISRGPAIGHGFQVDDVMLQQVADQINDGDGLKVRLQHYGDGIMDLVALADNARVEDGQARADLTFGQYAKSSPHGDLHTYLFDLAEDERMRRKVGLSIRFVPDDFESLTDSDTGLEMAPAGRVKELLSVDWTDDPGANPGGMLSGNRETPSKEDGAMNEALRKYLEGIGLKAEATEAEAQEFLSGLKDDQKVIAEALSAEPPKAAGVPKPPQQGDPPAGDPPAQGTLTAQQVATAAVAAERTRAKELRGLAETIGLDAAWAQEQIDAGTTVADGHKAAITALAKKRKAEPLGGHDIHVGTDRNRSTLAAGITDAVLLRAGVRLYDEDPTTRRVALDADGRPKVREPHERAREFRSLSLVEMAKAHLQAMGVPDAHMLGRTRSAELALSPRRLQREFGVLALAQGTSDFPYILEAAMGKSLRAAYVEASSTWEIWARRATATDFKTIKRASMGEAPDLVAQPEGGELTYATIGEGRETYVLVRYSQGLKLTWHAIINDDMDAFSRLPALQANAAKRKEDDVCYAVLTGNAALADGVALFHTASHGNLAGSGAVPSAATLNAMRAAMRVQTGPGGSILNLAPKFLIGPAALEGTVKPLLVSELVPGAPGSAGSGQNMWRGELVPVIEPRLDATVDADTDAATWYGACDSAQCDTVEVCFLEDEPEPVLRQETEFDTSDIKYAVRHVVAAKAVDHRGLYKNKGN